jgi:hypothetical protein
LEDHRFRELGYRLIYIEQPHALPSLARAQLDSWCLARLLEESEEHSPWRTLPRAIVEADDLIHAVGGNSAPQLVTIRAWLEQQHGELGARVAQGVPRLNLPILISSGNVQGSREVIGRGS